jgi:hypothetical protein
MTDDPTAAKSALAHLRAFRATFNDGDEVDEESGLIAADLDVAIEALELAPRMVGIQSIDLQDADAWKKIAGTIHHRG